MLSRPAVLTFSQNTPFLPGCIDSVVPVCLIPAFVFLFICLPSPFLRAHPKNSKCAAPLLIQ